MIYQYFSKWRKEWIDFKQEPTKGQIHCMNQYHYQIRNK